MCYTPPSPVCSCRGSTELIQHPNGAAPTCHTVFAVDRGCPWEKAKRLLDEEVRGSEIEEGFFFVRECVCVCVCVEGGGWGGWGCAARGEEK